MMDAKLNTLNVQENLQVAVSYQAAQKVDQAAEIYQAILGVEPEQPDALHLLGLIESQRGNHDKAVGLVRKATSLAPENPLFWSNYGVVLRHADKLDDAVSAYTRSLQLDANNADVCFNLGKALKLQGKLKEAEEQFKQSLQLNPKKVSAWLSLMNLASSVGKPELAITLADRALGILPDQPDILLNAGITLKRAKDFRRSIEYFEHLLRVVPNHVEAQCKLAGICISKQEFDRARQWIESASKEAPQSEHVLLHIGLLNNSLGDYENAAKVLSQAAQAYPKNNTILANLGIALKKLGRLTDAFQVMLRALKLDPKSRETLLNIAGVQLSLGMVSDAQNNFRKLLKTKGQNKDAHQSLLMSMQYDHSVAPEGLFAEHRRWNEVHGTASTGNDFNIGSSRLEQRPLRVGFVSPDLGNHPVGYFTVKLFEALNKSEIEPFVYSDRVGRDEIAMRIEQCATWTDVGGCTDLELRERIVEDKIDVLFDLAGHTSQNRLLLFAERAAPVQITWAGYVGTTGLDSMDFLLGDRFHLPEGSEAYASERLLRMPNSYVTCEPPVDAPAVSSLPALANGFTTFAAMCNPAKVNSDVFAAWREILHKLPSAKLLLCYSGWDDPANRKRALSELKLPEDSPQLRIEVRSGPVEVMALYSEADIALDTFPYSGGLTTCEAMWMGVPTITIEADRFAGRHSFSHQSVVGLSGFHSRDAKEYISKAVEWSQNVEELNKIRVNLRDQMRASPLCNGTLFASDFAKMLRQAWTEKAASC